MTFPKQSCRLFAPDPRQGKAPEGMALGQRTALCCRTGRKPPKEEVLEPGAEKNLFGLCERNSWLLRFFDVFGVDSP